MPSADESSESPAGVGSCGADRPLPRVVLGRVLHLLAQLLARPVVEPVAEHRAEGVVGLVLEAAGEQAAALVGDVLARRGPGRHLRVVGPGAVDERTRVGEAALLGVVELAVLALRQLERPGCRRRRGGWCRRRPGSRRRTPPGRPRSGRRRARPRRRRTSWRPCRRPVRAAPRRTTSPGAPCGASPRCPSGSPGGPCRPAGARPRWGTRAVSRVLVPQQGRGWPWRESYGVSRATWAKCGATCNSQLHSVSCLRTQASARP